MLFLFAVRLTLYYIVMRLPSYFFAGLTFYNRMRNANRKAQEPQLF